MSGPAQTTWTRKKAGLRPWQRIFHNLRASRETELAKVLELAPKKPKDHLMVVNLSGRGDKDLDTVSHHLESKAR